MIALDTNVLVRYIAQDDQVQATQVNVLMDLLSASVPALISTIVMCELCWVLKSAYRAPKSRLVEVLEAVLEVPVFRFENLKLCAGALEKFRTGGADYSDYIISESSENVSCSAVVSFDKSAKSSAGFIGIEDAINLLSSDQSEY